MSRLRIFTTLFLTLIVGTAASIFLYQQWFVSYHEMVLKPGLSQDRAASKAAIELYAFHKMQAATRHVLGAKRLLSAFEQSDTKQRHDSAFDELNALKSKAGIKGASFLVVTDGEGKAFANAATVNWKADWSKRHSVTAALAGNAAHGVGMFQKKPHIFVAIPIISDAKAGSAPAAPAAKDGDDDDDGKTKKPAAGRTKPKARRRKPPARRAAKKGKCSAGKYWYCYTKCVKRAEKKKGVRYAKCLKRAKKPTCFCRTRKKKKTGALTTPKRTHRLAQKAPDDRAKAKAKGDDDKEPADARPIKPVIKKSKAIGVVVIGFALNKDVADAIKKKTNLDIVFFSTAGGTYGDTLKGKMLKHINKLMSSKNPTSIAIKARKDNAPFHISFAKGGAFAALSAPLGKVSTGMLLLKPMKKTYKLFWDYNRSVAIIMGICFLFAVLLLLAGATSFQRQLESIEEKLLDTYNRGDLNLTFNESAPWILGPFSATLNLLYRQLRGEPDVDDPRPRGAMDWSALEGNQLTPTPAPAAPAPVVETIPEPPPGPQPKTEEAVLTDEGSDEVGDGLSTAEMINHFLENPDAHYLDVYNRYRDAKEECGEDVSRLKQAKFIEKLRKNAETYAGKYDCKGVLFDVTIKDNKVILKPQLIPKE